MHHSMYVYLALSLVVVLVAADLKIGDDSSIGDCSADDVAKFISALPNGGDCHRALGVIRSPGSAGKDVLESALDMFCTPDCGEVLAKYIATTCNALALGTMLTLSCTPKESGSFRCRHAFPDLLTQISDLESCVDTVDVCPATCKNGLVELINEIGCCYETLYSDTFVIHEQVKEGLLSVEVMELLFTLDQHDLWAACELDFPTYCTGDPFPGESSLAVGICSEGQLNEFISSLSSDCIGSDAISQGPGVSGDASLDKWCQKDCAGELVKFQTDTCLDEFASLLLEVACYKTDGSLGSRCKSTLGENFTNAKFFVDVGRLCFKPDLFPTTCPSGCGSALTELSSKLGCCFQAIYNNSVILDTSFVAGEVNFEEGLFLEGLVNPNVWEHCDVPLIPMCDGDPFQQ